MIRQSRMCLTRKSLTLRFGCIGVPCLPLKTGTVHWRWSSISRDLFIILPVCRISVHWSLPSIISMNPWFCPWKSIWRRPESISGLTRKWPMWSLRLITGKKWQRQSNARRKGWKRALCSRRRTLCLWPTGAVRKEPYTATRTTRPTEMRKYVQAAAGACGKILRSRILPSVIRRSSVPMWRKQTGSPPRSLPWTIRFFLILRRYANVIPKAEEWLPEGSSAVRIPAGC